jgi:uncharacterized protein (TIGR03790 family)
MPRETAHTVLKSLTAFMQKVSAWQDTALSVLVCLSLLVLPGCAQPQSANAAHPMAPRVLVVFHADIAPSQTVARHYARLRGIPDRNVCGLSFPNEFLLSGAQYLHTVKPALRRCLQRAGERQVLYIVFSYRTPYKVSIPGQRFEASLDSLAADIWDEANRSPLPPQVSVPQPYFSAASSQANIYPAFESLATFRDKPNAPRIYSVWRLDAASAELAQGLVDKAMRTEAKGGPQGKGCFDRNRKDIRNTNDDGYVAGEWDIQRAADLTRMAGFDVELDTNRQEFGTAPAPMHCGPAALFAGWYSLNNYNDAFTWSEGAIGLHLDSMSAWNLREGKSWVTNAVSKGITVSGGAVSEPYLPNLTQADGMLFALFRGANVGDAFLRNTRLLKFRIVNVGDPLYTPFPGGKGAFREGIVPSPAVYVRSPRTLGGVPGVVRVRAGGDLNKARQVRLSVHPAKLGSVPPTLRFDPGVDEQDVQIPTAGVAEAAKLRVHVDTDEGMAAGVIQVFPALRAWTPDTVQLRSGGTVKLTLQVGAQVVSQPAPIDLKSNCPKEVTVPERVFVQPGRDRIEVEIQAATIGREATCEVRAEKFEVALPATLQLQP